MRMDFFDALAKGYLSEAKDFLNEAEKGYLAKAGKVITFQLGVRFTDHLSSDTYFRVHREGQNRPGSGSIEAGGAHARKRGSDEDDYRRAWLVGCDEAPLGQALRVRRRGVAR